MAVAEHIHKSYMPSTAEEMRAFLDSLDTEELREIYQTTAQLEERISTYGPQNDDELHEWIKHELGLDIPRESVCPDHDAPFIFIADVFFERCDAALLMANRGGGKTFMVAIIHWLNSRFKPGCESLTFGAVQNQSNRAYSHLKKWIYDENGDKKPIVTSSLMSETVFRNGSKIEVLGSTPEQVNGPHPHKAHADEIELMRDDTWKESRNMRSTIDTPVSTPQGWKTIGDLEIDDFVFGLDGLPKRVLDLHEIAEHDVYRVELTDGRWTECCDEHLWMVCNQPSRSKGAPFRVVQTQEMIATGLKRGANYLYGLPLIEPVSYPEANLLIDPYVLGVLIGDGCLRERVATFRADEQDIVDEVSRRLPDDVRVMFDTKNDGTKTYRISKLTTANSRNPVMAALDGLDLTGRGSHDKFIPDVYKIASTQQRLDLLRGLMDTDGSFTKDPYFATVSEQLAKDVSEIVYSLGGRGLLRKKQTSPSAKAWGSCGYIFEVSTSLPEGVVPFLCERKVAKFATRRRTLGAAIRSITCVGRKLARCITVEDSMYLVNNYIPTHNTVAGKTRDGRTILPQDILTSTRKGPSGRMQELIDEIDEAVAEGYEPPRAFYKYCIKETAAERPNCQMVDPVVRETRLAALGLDTSSVCDCHLVRKGKWDEEGPRNGKPRLLSEVCDGDFFRSRGWQPPAEIKKQFRENDQDTFEVQQLCSKAELKFHYFGSYSDAHHGIRNFDPDPENGPIFTSTDWGGTNPHSVHWYQLLTNEVEVDGWVLLADGSYPRVRVKEGTIVCFDELYEAEIGNDALGDLVIKKENSYRQQFPTFHVTERFADPQGKAARLDWKDKGLKCTWHITREFDEHIKAINSYVVDDDLFRIVAENCPEWRREVKAWRKDEETLKQIDENNHAMSDFRYAVANIRKLRKKYIKKLKASLPGAAGPGRSAPQVTVTTIRRSEDDGPIGLRDKNDYANWRKGLGEPVSAFGRRR